MHLYVSIAIHECRYRKALNASRTLCLGALSKKHCKLSEIIDGSCIDDINENFVKTKNLEGVVETVGHI